MTAHQPIQAAAQTAETQEIGASASPTVATHEPSPTSGLGPSGECQLAGFTPGPWGIEQTRDMLWVGPLRPDGHKVDEVVVGLNIDPDLTMTAALRQYRNARLIAAAPELLEALQGLLASHKQGRGQCCEAADRAIDAIAKATGAA